MQSNTTPNTFLCFHQYQMRLLQNMNEQQIEVIDDRFRKEIQEFTRNKYQAQQLQQLIVVIGQEDIIKRHYAIIGIRKLHQDSEISAIQELMNQQAISKIVKLAEQDQYPQIKLQAVRIIASQLRCNNHSSMFVRQLNVVLLLACLLKSRCQIIFQLAAKSLGYIAFTKTIIPVSKMPKECISNLVDILRGTPQKRTIKICVWALSNICNEYPLEEYQFVEGAIDALLDVLESKQLETPHIQNICWSAITRHSSKMKLYQIRKSSILLKALQNLTSFPIKYMFYSLKIISNISANYPDQITHLPLEDIFVHISPLMRSKNQAAQYAYQFLAKITKNSTQAQKIVNNAILFEAIVKGLKELASIEVKKDILLLLSNLIENMSSSHIFDILAKFNIYENVVILLCMSNQKLIQQTLSFLYLLFAHGQQYSSKTKNMTVEHFQSANGVSVLDKLMIHKSQCVFNWASLLISRYLSDL